MLALAQTHLSVLYRRATLTSNIIVQGSQHMRRSSKLDLCLGVIDVGLRISSGVHTGVERSSPARNQPHAELNEAEQTESIRLMRVNHAGEVAAQALYLGQALGAREPALRKTLETAAKEEADHLSWCTERLHELGGQTSRLSAFWYLGSMALGVVAGRAGDRWSLGFVAETEHQVSAHLDQHLQRLPNADHRSRAVLEAMRIDEQQHAAHAETLGAAPLPPPIKALMRATSKIVTQMARWV